MMGQALTNFGQTLNNLSYTLIPDTGALFFENERTEDLSSSFLGLVKECREHCSLRILVPETVYGELLYQKVYACLGICQKGL